MSWPFYQSSGTVWKSRWLSWAHVPNKHTVSVAVKQHFNNMAPLFNTAASLVVGPRQSQFREETSPAIQGSDSPPFIAAGSQSLLMCSRPLQEPPSEGQPTVLQNPSSACLTHGLTGRDCSNLKWSVYLHWIPTLAHKKWIHMMILLKPNLFLMVDYPKPKCSF